MILPQQICQHEACGGSRRRSSFTCCRTKGGLCRSAACAVLVVLSLSAPVSCEGARAARLDESEGPAGRRRAQVGAPEVPRDQPACVTFAERAELAGLCGTTAGTELCPGACAAASALVGTPSPETRLCHQMAARGTLMCTSDADICPDACANSTSGTGVPGVFTRGDGAGLYQVNCLILLKLEGGCAYDLSQEDRAVAPNTRVSTVCPNECSGHGQCVGEGSALDVAFLGLTDDSSGHGGSVELQGSACVDGGGVTFDGEGWATITPGQEYGNEADCTVTFWALPAAADVWTPHREAGSENSQPLYIHPPRASTQAPPPQCDFHGSL